MLIGFAITRAAAVDATWTTVALAHAALERGWRVCIVEPWDWQIDPDGTVCGRAHRFDQPLEPESLARALVHRLATRWRFEAQELDLLMLRASPLDPTLLTFARLVQDLGVPVVNDPAALFAVHHKGWLAAQSDVPTPPTLVTRSRAAAALFLTQLPKGAVVKPARGSGGRNVARIRPGDTRALDQAFDTALKVGDGFVVVQGWVSEASQGEKRLIWLDGDLIGGYLRQRAPGEFRHNLKHGGRPHPTQITDRERESVARLSPSLKEAGIRLAGLDLIGAQITEVNVLNPGGVHHADRLSGTHLAHNILERLIEPTSYPKATWALPVP